MATATHMIRKLTNAEFEIQEQTERRVVAVKKNSYGDAIEISFWIQDGRGGSPNVRRTEDISDLHTDYFAGYFASNIKQAIESVDETLASKARIREAHERGGCEEWCALCRSARR